MIDLHIRAARAADEVVMLMAGDLVNKMTVGIQSRTDHIILGQEFQRAVYGCFGHAFGSLADMLVDLGGREVARRSLQVCEDGNALRSDPVTPRTQFLQKLMIGHKSPYCEFLQ